MKKTVKIGLLSTVAMFCFANAYAQSVDESIEERIATLEAALAQLKDELAAEKKERAALEAKASGHVKQLNVVHDRVEMIDATLTSVDERVTAVDELSHKKGFRVGDSTLKVGGYVDLDTHFTHFLMGVLQALPPRGIF